ncbi:MAG: response regulator [Dehalococcoidia bacterium]
MPKKILIVEDEADIRVALVAWFEDEGYEIFEADNGIAGLLEFEQCQPDLALLDMNMPGMTGTELCRRIREFSRVPLVMFTAAADVEEVQAAINEGATDWVLKHSGFDTLLDRIAGHLNVERDSISKADLQEAIPARMLSPPEPQLSGFEKTVEVGSKGGLNIELSTLDDLWTWSGEYFGFRDGSDLWTYNGHHVGRFRRESEVYGPDGLYLGDVIDGRLVIDWHKTARRASSFTPHGNQAPRRVFNDREPLDIGIGFKDFPNAQSLTDGTMAA